MSDNIFADLYNKLLGFFRQAEAEENSKDVARNRLRVVLMQDRTNLTPQLLERMRGELVELLSKYLEMDKDALELNLDQDGEQMALALSIPVIRAKDEEEIQKAIEEEEARKAKAAEEKEEDESEEESEEETDESEEDSEGKEEKSSDETEETEKEVEEKKEETKTETKPSKKAEKKEFPDKEICGDCRECELSDDIECEKKDSPEKTK